MTPDRPFIVAVASLATGVALIVGYCQGTTGMILAYPFSSSTLHMDLTTAGPAVLGGVALIALGLLLMAWALLAAIVHQISLLTGREDRMERHWRRRRDRDWDRDRETVFEEDEPYPGSLGVAQHRHEG